MRAIEFQYDLLRKNKLSGPNVGICSKAFNLAAARKEIRFNHEFNVKPNLKKIIINSTLNQF